MNTNQIPPQNNMQKRNSANAEMKVPRSSGNRLPVSSSNRMPQYGSGLFNHKLDDEQDQLIRLQADFEFL